MKVWFDITNTPQVHFLLAVEDMIKSFKPDTVPLYSTREFSETVKMLERKVGKGNFITIGNHKGKSYIKKIMGLFERFNSLNKVKLDYDLSISCGSESAVWKSFLEHKKSITFGDNDLARQWTYGYITDYAFFPNAIDEKKLNSQGLKNKLYLYNGYKEDVYLSKYTPDDSFLSLLPFDNYVLVRPENIMANYIRNGNVKSITPDLLKILSEKGYHILYLPRYDIDKDYSKEIKNVFVPDAPINGLDACYYADAVLTGAGTFAREAACLGVPSFSFFAGSDLLAVDKKMIREEKMYFSRDVGDIMKHLLLSKKTSPNLNRCKETVSEIRCQIECLFSKWEF